ncbi:MAG: type II secretion system protein GspD [Ignavibacteriales bacterium]|nr:type II secretion system protein GspD [Ignavibacteriales bacterium]
MKKCSVKQCYKLLFLLIVFASGLKAQQPTERPPNCDKVISSLNFKNTDIRDVLRSIAYEYETNIVIDNMVDAKITVALFNISVADAIRIIAEDNRFDFSFDKQRFFVKPPKEKALPPPPAEPEPMVNFTDNKLTIDLNGIEVNKLVKVLKEKTNRNFLLTNGANGKVTGSLSNIEFDTGLRNILQNNGFYLTVKDSIYYISRSSYYSSLDNAGVKPAGAYWVNARNGKVTIDVVQANADRVIDDIANQMSLQVIKLAPVQGNVTVRCTDVPVERAFNFILKGTEFTFKEEQGAYLFGNKTSKSLDNSKLLKMKFLQADKVKERLPGNVSQLATISVILEHNALVLSGTNEGINSVEEYIKVIDQPVAQVLIEALVVDYNLDDMLKLGISASRGDSLAATRADKWFPGLDITAGGQKINNLLNSVGNINLFGAEIGVDKLGKLPADFYVNLRAMEQSGIANVRSKPVLSTLNGNTASLKIGTVQNYILNELMPVNSLSTTANYIQKETIQKIEASISFEITPWVGPNHELTLTIKPDFQTPIGAFSSDKRYIPAINTRSFVSTVRLRDGETIILGGLIQESETDSEEKVPLLGSIPYLGNLFKNVDKKKTKGELMIYLTPKIYYGDDFGNVYYNFAK